jgi:hypothetical protein
METYKYLANCIPEMGNGGRKIKNELMREAKEVLPGNSIFDFAPFIGSTTAFLACGLIEAKNFESVIHSVDKWEMDKKYAVWIKEREIKTDDLQKEHLKNIQPFVNAGVKIESTKSDIRNYTYPGDPVQLLIDDLGVCKSITDSVLKNTIPYMIPGLTIIFFMDYYFYESYHDYKSRVYQRDLMKANKKVFEFIEHPKHSRTAIYRYLGGEVNYIEGEQYYYDWKGCMG